MRKRIFSFNHFGFTLLEMVVTIAVIAILATLVLAMLNPIAQFQKADDGKRKGDLAQVQRALEQYYEDFGVYPPSIVDSSGNYDIKGLSGQAVPWGTSWAPYMDLLPKDSQNPSRRYVYTVSSDGQKYWLYASLERATEDPQACNTTNSPCPNASGLATTACGTATGAVCDFGVSSSNTTP